MLSSVTSYTKDKRDYPSLINVYGTSPAQNKLFSKPNMPDLGTPVKHYVKFF